MSETARPVSAARIAEQLGDRLPAVDSLPVEAFDLVDATRSLMEGVVMTDVDPEARAAAARAIRSVVSDLAAVQRAEPLLLARRGGGRGVESLLQAGTGRLNPQAPPVEWTERPVEPEPGSAPVPATVRATCRFTAAHAGSPGRVHGGVIATVLDEALGHAVTCSGVSGMTVSLTVSLRGATPLDEPVEIVGRYTGHEGRKSFASGEVVVDGRVTAEASAIYVSERRHD
jgi:acyl-coenzyme A thioesterase PaaI-like protein